MVFSMNRYRYKNIIILYKRSWKRTRKVQIFDLPNLASYILKKKKKKDTDDPKLIDRLD